MPARPRRRAVGPPGAPAPGAEPSGLEVAEQAEREVPPDDDERLRADRPPHHDRGV